MAQFGIHGDTAVSRAWRSRTIPDDTVRVVNQRGTMAFARGGPNTRSVQLFFNLVDNTPRIDTLNNFGFPPLGQVIQGIAVLDSLNSEYSTPARRYPRIDYILTARVIRSGAEYQTSALIRSRSTLPPLTMATT